MVANDLKALAKFRRPPSARFAIDMAGLSAIKLQQRRAQSWHEQRRERASLRRFELQTDETTFLAPALYMVEQHGFSEAS